VYVLHNAALVEMTWLEGLKVGYDEGISERVGCVIEGEIERELHLHPSWILLLLVIDFSRGCVDVQFLDQRSGRSGCRVWS
jgi:hypothetical protein